MPRNVALDGLRGLAALMVFVHHVRLPGLERATVGLDAGVMIFFALSGYLLYRPFVDGRVGVGGYAIRRALRIWPAFAIAAVAVSLLWYPAFLADPIALVTMQRTPIVVVWTLIIEVWFYISLPIVAAVLGRVGRPELWICAGAVASLAIGAVEIVLTRTSPIGFPAWAWAFAPGMLLAIPEVRARMASVAVPALAVLTLGISIVFDLGYPDLPGAIGSGLVVAWALGRPNLGGQLAVALGALSYSVYLWHLPIIDAVDRPASWTGAAMALGLTVAIASAVYLLLERPAIRLGRLLSRGFTDALKVGRSTGHPSLAVEPEMIEPPRPLRHHRL